LFIVKLLDGLLFEPAELLVIVLPVKKHELGLAKHQSVMACFVAGEFKLLAVGLGRVTRALQVDVDELWGLFRLLFIRF
jgi:hypothetical protein